MAGSRNVKGARVENERRVEKEKGKKRENNERVRRRTYDRPVDI